MPRLTPTIPTCSPIFPGKRSRDILQTRGQRLEHLSQRTNSNKLQLNTREEKLRFIPRSTYFSLTNGIFGETRSRTKFRVWFSLVGSSPQYGSLVPNHFGRLTRLTKSRLCDILESLPLMSVPRAIPYFIRDRLLRRHQLFIFLIGAIGVLPTFLTWCVFLCVTTIRCEAKLQIKKFQTNYDHETLLCPTPRLLNENHRLIETSESKKKMVVCLHF